MALHKRPDPAPKMPFPGESPTISLALAAAKKYGLAAEEEKAPAKAGKKATAKPKRKAKPRAKSAR